MISETDLILNPDGSIYHLLLKPEDIADTILTVGDPDRVQAVSRYFDHIELKKGRREFITHTGYIGNKRITVISTGIGTDNIDIVLNELDGLVNVDLATRTVKQDLTSLNIIRIGTSGTIQDDIPLDSVLITEYAVGLDPLMHYYRHEVSGDEHLLLEALANHISHYRGLAPYITRGSDELIQKFESEFQKGVTITAPGFYAPQGRNVRAKAVHPELLDHLAAFKLNDFRITNLEMETAGIYSLSRVLGHRALSVNALLANRKQKVFSAHPDKTVDQAIQKVINILAS